MTARGEGLIKLVMVAAAAGVATIGTLIGATSPPRKPVELDLPEAYRLRQNPVAGDPAAVGRGRKLFESKGCVACHGIKADGKGPSSAGISPAPADFVGGTVLKDHTDNYLFWRISEGKHGTAMPNWKGVLEERERWEIVMYLRSLEKK